MRLCNDGAVAYSQGLPGFLGRRVAHPEGQNEEENKSSLRKNLSKFEDKMRKVELLPTRDCEAGYGPMIRNPVRHDFQ